MSASKKLYKSFQVNIPKEKHKDLIEWLIYRASEQETSLNSIIILALKEYWRNHEEKDND